MTLQKRIEKLLTGLVAMGFPALLLAIAGAMLLWRLADSEASTATPIPIQVLEESSAVETPVSRAQILETLRHKEASISVETKLSTNGFWFLLPPQAPALSAGGTVIDFPSRHATGLSCWDAQTDKALGSANRWETQGQISKSRAGFALMQPGDTPLGSVLCQGFFRGPAKISADLSDQESMRLAEISHLKIGVMIEAGIGVLALFMMLTAWVNKSALYWTFAGWLILNMRMAGISAGTDFDLFGAAIEPSILFNLRQWTVCLYFSMTGVLFSTLFKQELSSLKAGWALSVMQLSTVILPVVCLFLSFEQTLMLIWPSTAMGITIIAWYLVKIMRHSPSRVAAWYAASIGVTLLASLNEVIAASTGQRNLIVGLNSMTAAVTSALLASAAVAEHMRAVRQEKLEAQRSLNAAYQGSPIGLFTADADGLLVKSNPAFRTMLQTVRPHVPAYLSQIFDADVTQAITTLRASGSRESLDLKTKVTPPDSAAEYWFSIRASSTDGALVEGTLQDITERVRATARLEFLANHDPLTECLNLRGITRKFDRYALQPSALVYFDLDRFKLINDLYGHSAGDNVLKQVCERLKSHVRPTDWLARLGGDEFVIAFSDCTMARAADVSRDIINSISATAYQIENQSFTLSISGGLVGTAQFSQSPLQEVISAADTLCRMAKKRPTEKLVVMESDDQFFQYHKEELDIIAALERGETPSGLYLVMQPEISLTKPFESLNFEVLIRMKKTDGQVIPANVIVEAAEAHGKSAIIDRWVVTTIVQWLEDNAAALKNTHFVGVNLSGGSLNDETFTEELFSIFERHPTALSKICLEITETVALTDMHNMQRIIDRVRKMGGKVALDDFGAGFSSFGYLKGLSVDALKLDGSLVKDAARSPAGMAIIEAIAGMVNSLGMKSIGEFAEDLPTIKALYEAGVDYAQGYGISRPVLPATLLAATSGADFIEDPEILAFLTQIQYKVDHAVPLFVTATNNSHWGEAA